MRHLIAAAGRLKTKPPRRQPLSFFSSQCRAKSSRMARHLPPKLQQHWVHAIKQAAKRPDLTQQLRAIIAGEDLVLPVDDKSYALIEYGYQQEILSKAQRLTQLLWLQAKVQGRWVNSENARSFVLELSPNQVSSVALFDSDGRLTRQGSDYIRAIRQRAMQLKLPLDENKLLADIKAAPPGEQQIFRAQNYSDIDTQLSHAYDINASLMPYIVEDSIMECLWYGSGSVFYAMLAQLAPGHFELEPIFGLVGESDYLQMHKQQQHPLALYRPELENLSLVHGLLNDPLCALFHDLTHVFMSGLLPLDERDYLFEQLLPTLKASLETMTIEQAQLKEKISGIIDELADLNLSFNGQLIHDVNDYIAIIIEHHCHDKTMLNQHCRDWLNSALDELNKKNITRIPRC